MQVAVQAMSRETYGHTSADSCFWLGPSRLAYPTKFNQPARTPKKDLKGTRKSNVLFKGPSADVCGRESSHEKL